MSKTPNGIPHPEEEEVWEVQTFELTYAHRLPFTLPPGWIPLNAVVVESQAYLVAVRKKDGPAKPAETNPLPTNGYDVVEALTGSNQWYENRGRWQ